MISKSRPAGSKPRSVKVPFSFTVAEHKLLKRAAALKGETMAYFVCSVCLHEAEAVVKGNKHDMPANALA